MRAKSRKYLLRVAGWSAYASAVVAICGLLPFVTFFAFGVNLPRLNDIAVIVQYLLALPMILALYPLVQARAPLRSRVAMLIGIVGMVGVAVVQVLWLLEAFRWMKYIMFIGTAMLMIGAWVVITGSCLRILTGPLRHGLLMSILAATYFGYPIWAIWLGRLLLEDRLAISGPVTRGVT